MNTVGRIEQYIVSDKLIYSLDKYSDIGILKVASSNPYVKLVQDQNSETLISPKSNIKEADVDDSHIHELMQKHHLKGILKKKSGEEDKSYGEVPKELEVSEEVNSQTIKFIIKPYEEFEGLPVDQRLFRKEIFERSSNKSVLNLFSNTGFNSLYSLFGGAKNIDSIESSQSNIEWMNQNLHLNQSFKAKSEIWNYTPFDFIEYAIENNAKYDLIILDLSSYTLKQMTDFKLNEDHVFLIRKIQRKLLNYAGYLFLVSNFDDFVLDQYIRPGADKLTKTTVAKEYLPLRPHQSFVFYN